MTDEEIDAMEAGQELDHIIAEDIFGLRVFHEQTDGKLYLAASQFHHEWQEVPHYSTDIAAAWQVVEKMRECRCLFTLHLMGVDWEAGDLKPNAWYAHFDFALHPSGCFSAEASTAPLAICRAALKCCKNVADKKEGAWEAPSYNELNVDLT